MKLCPKCQKQFSSEANFCPVDAAPLVPLPEAAADDSLSQRFDLGDRLGGNRTGAVHRATEKATGTAFAVKLVASNVVAWPGAVQRAERELQQIERVQSAGIAKVVGFGKKADQLWVAMELLENVRTLAAVVSAEGPVPVRRAAEVIEAIGTALIDAAHAGIVHRDLAPKNVLIVGNAVKLINFPLAVTPSEKVQGVPEFVAPEQVEGRPIDQRSNLYSLGALYYYMLTGRTVFEGTPDAVYELHRTGTIPPPSQIAPNAIAAGSPLEAAIVRALDRSPNKRFLTLRQFVDEVVRVGRGGDAPAAPKSLGKERSAKPSSSTPASAGAAQTVLGMAPPIMPAAIASPGQPSSAPKTSSPAEPIAPPATARVAAASSPPVPAGAAAASPAMAGAAAASPAVASAAAASPAMASAATASPTATAAVVAPPVVAVPKAAGATGKKRAVDSESNKGKFRETLWFKKGDLDVQAALAAAEERSRTGAEASADKADTLPIDERYKDDGSLTHGDTERYSLRTGATQTLRALPSDGNVDAANVSPDALIDEMKGGRTKIIAGVVIAVLALIAIILFAAK